MLQELAGHEADGFPQEEMSIESVAVVTEAGTFARYGREMVSIGHRGRGSAMTYVPEPNATRAQTLIRDHVSCFAIIEDSLDAGDIELRSPNTSPVGRERFTVAVCSLLNLEIESASETECR